MKHLTRYVLLAMAFASTIVYGDNGSNRGSPGDDSIQADDTAYMAAQTTKDAKAFNVSISGDWIAKTKLKREHSHRGDRWVHNNFHFAQAFADLGVVFYYNPCYVEGLTATLEYGFYDFDWKTNPYFRQRYFHNASLSIGGFTHRFKRWEWKAQAAMNVDAHTWNFNEYLTLDFLLWGRYEFRHNIGIHVGILAETGMKVDRVYPIIGVDWQVTKKFKLNLVYPINVSAVYQFNCNWSVAAAGRLWSVRQRASQHDWLKKAILVYRSAGAELAVNCDYSWFEANVHAGYTFAGKVTIANKHYKHKNHYNVDSAPYVGGELAVKF